MAESDKERTDRQLVELLNELRVALPGAQVLLAFLLTAPFATRFGRTTSLQRALFFACTVVTAAGIIMLLGPSIYHRMRWQKGGKEDVVRVGHALFLAGTACLGAGLLCAVFLIADVLYGGVEATITTAVLGVVAVGTWYVLPLRRGGSPVVREHE